MKVSRSVIEASFSGVQQPARRFDGTVEQELIGEQHGVRVSIVHFYDGARTYVHSHTGGQVLLILQGTAKVGKVANGITQEHPELAPGDMVHAAPGEPHWHGAAPGTNMTHLSIAIGPSTWNGPPPKRDE